MFPISLPVEPPNFDVIATYQQASNYVSVRQIKESNSFLSETFDSIFSPAIVSKDVENIRARIYDENIFPEDWEKQGIARPNVASKARAFDVCQALYVRYKMLPSKISATKEEGVYISFRNDINTKDLVIEVYNNLEVAAIVKNNEHRAIDYSEDIYGFDFTEAVEALNT